jgi:aminoglycoside phosphotransferase
VLISDVPDSTPRQLWPELTNWEAVGMVEAVYRVRTPLGEMAYVRPDDGSAPVLSRECMRAHLPVPRVLEVREGWMLLSALPGVPLHEEVWRSRPDDVVRISASALEALRRAGVTHGDMSLPNILGDPGTAELTGIVDWRYAERFGPEVDVAAVTWSLRYNGYPDDVALALLRVVGWRDTDQTELGRLRRIWKELGEPSE